ncbi:MAG: MoaD/ThiS family protein [Tindallia sp. MSAO_Bac2]|nr:MAG: MoaD/ThiS family protein [Tindallia sp. MSAO_Bac2]
MNVQVKWMTDSRKTEVIDIHEKATVGELLNKLNINNHEDFLIVINGKNRLSDYVLHNEDQVKIFHSMAGG